MSASSWRDKLLRVDRDATPQSAVSRWGGDPETIAFASLRSNVVFRFERLGEPCYLRLTHTDLRDVDEVESVVVFARHLFDGGAAVCEPLRSEAGGWVEPVEQGGDVFLASVTREINGRTLDRSCDDPAVFAAIGRALGSTHLAAATFVPADPSSFRTIDSQWALLRVRLADAEPAIRHEVERIGSWLASLSRQVDFGLTHADCNATNFLWDGGQVGIIDFDEPMFQWFAADVARPFREFPTESIRREACLRAIVSGYRERRPLADEWVRRIPWFVRLIELDHYGWARQLPPGSLLPGDVRREDNLAELERHLAIPLPD